MKATDDELRSPSGENSIDDNQPTLSILPNAKDSLSTRKSNSPDLPKLMMDDIHQRQIAGNIKQVFWLRDLNSGRILYVNPAFEAVWGRSCESLYADPAILMGSVHPEDRVQVLVAGSHEEHKTIDQAYRILRSDGSLRWILARTFSIEDESGVPFSQFCIADDITDQKNIEITQHKTLNRIREQFDLSHKMSLARKPRLVLKTLMSAQKLRTARRASLLYFEAPKTGLIHGVEIAETWSSDQNMPPWYHESSLYGAPSFLALFHPMRTKVLNGIKTSSRLTPSERGILLEAQIQSLVIFPLVALGNWFGCLLVYFDHEVRFDHIELKQLKVIIDQAAITLFNLKLLQSEEESRHEAERANEIKTEFLAMISHELRTPLTSIIGFITTLLAEDVSWAPDEQHDFLLTIQQEADRLQELIDHLLDLSRLEAGKLPIALKPHLLHEILEDAMPQLNMLTDGHTLTLDLMENYSVYADAKRITQVLVNLIHNACTYAPRGSEIKIAANLRGDYLQINVIDQGPGIPISDHKKVFKAFSRGKNEENGISKGAGLGLAICKGLVEAHGGHIWIEKKSTPGTTVSFTIPRGPTLSSVITAEEE
jgi:PAS domain S-box-containing protein